MAQGEKLRKADQRLDEIAATTKETQRHLTGIKSLFGGMKNYFAGKPKKPVETDAVANQPANKPASKLDTTVTQLKSDPIGGYEASSEDKRNIKKSDTSGSVRSDAKLASLQGTQWEDTDHEIDQNLGNHVIPPIIIAIGIN